jgi:hypothetical protein
MLLYTYTVCLVLSQFVNKLRLQNLGLNNYTRQISLLEDDTSLGNQETTAICLRDQDEALVSLSLIQT